MEILLLLIFISAVLVVSAVAFFVWTVCQRSQEHIDRLALLPLNESQVQPAGQNATKE